MTQKITYGKQYIDRADIQAVINVLKSDYITQGPCVENFEKAIANYCQVKYAVSFSSGTAALHGACFAAGISLGDEVITTPLTFVASANCVLYCDGKPVFADTKKDLPVIDPSEIKKKITSKTKAIISVDYSGFPADYDEINKIAKKNKLIVIADAAHSLGASYKTKKVGLLTDMTVFSFHPVKSITTGEGGMVVTDSEQFFHRLQLFRTHGITKDPKQFQKKSQGPWYYEMQELGFNYRLNDIQAVLGISQLAKLNRFITKRCQIAQFYLQTFNKSDGIDCLQLSPGRKSAWHIFPILLKEKLIKYKKDIVKDLHKQGIYVQVHYIPVHLHPYYQKNLGYQKGDFPHSEAFYEREISLPIYPYITVQEINYIVNNINKILNKYS